MGTGVLNVCYEVGIMWSRAQIADIGMYGMIDNYNSLHQLQLNVHMHGVCALLDAFTLIL
jgi:hypothetical protein